MIRSATTDDIPALLVLGEQFHLASPYAHLPFDTVRVTNTLNAAMNDGIVVVHGDPVDGMAGAIKGPLWFADGFAAQELFLWGRGGKELRLALEAWARREGCGTFSMVCLENERFPVISRMYRMAGYHPTEHHFVKSL